MVSHRTLIVGLFWGLSALSVGCNRQESPTASAAAEALRPLTVEQVEQRIADQKAGKAPVFIYDNNDRDTYSAGHVPGAKWVRFDGVSAADLPADKGATLIFYCSNES